MLQSPSCRSADDYCGPEVLYTNLFTGMSRVDHMGAGINQARFAE